MFASIALIVTSLAVLGGAQTPADRLRFVDCKSVVPAPLQASIPAGIELPPTLQCGYLSVPSDHNDSSSPPLNVAFTINRAANPIKNGTKALIYQPGGPGIENFSNGFLLALNQSAPFGADLRTLAMFDIITADPRGMFASTNLNCSKEAFLALDASFPRNQSDLDTKAAQSAALAQSCAGDSTYGDNVLSLFGAASNAKDYNMLLQALGYEKAHYLASSWGTFIGQQMFRLFPKRLDRVVLDGVYSDGMSPSFTHQTAMKARTRSIESIDASCISDPSCPLASQGKGSVQKVVAAVFAAAQQGTFAAQNVTKASISILLAYATSNAQRYQLTGVLGLATQGNVSALAVGNPISLGAIPQTIPVVCQDIVPRSVDIALFSNISKAAASDDRYNLTESLNSIYYTTCAGWPKARSAQTPVKIKTPYMLVTSDFDANTPTEWTSFLWERSPKAVLVARHGDGHPTFTRQDISPNPARDAIFAYLQTGTLPSAKSDAFHTIYAANADRKSRTVGDPYEVFAKQAAAMSGGGDGGGASATPIASASASASAAAGRQ